MFCVTKTVLTKLFENISFFHLFLHTDDSINFTMLSRANDLYILMLGLSAFGVEMNFLHLLRYNRTISLLGATLRESANDLKNVLVFLLIVIGAYTSFTFIYFGPFILEYRTIENAFTTLISNSMGHYDFAQVEEAAGKLGAVMMLSYMLLMMYFMLNIFITILNEFISALRDDPVAAPEDPEVIDHVLNQVKRSVGHVSKREKSHQEEMRRMSRLL